MAITPVDNPSLKWKGPVDSTAQTPPPIEYDVDDPTFCSPESVLSGLASGYCERRAVLNPEFVVSFGATEAQNTVLNWNDATSSTAYRESIVHNLVENIAAHNTALVSAFCENDASFIAPMTSTAQAPSTYMTHMDGMITELIASGGYSTAFTGGTAYQTFDEVAKSASAAAATAGSAQTGSAISGGKAYSSQFMPAFPAKWAKERKWMLDQLRYASTTIAYSVDTLEIQQEWDMALTDTTSTQKTVSATVYDDIKNAVVPSDVLVTVGAGNYGWHRNFDNREIGFNFYRWNGEDYVSGGEGMLPGYVIYPIESYTIGNRPSYLPVVGTTGYVNVYIGPTNSGTQPGYEDVYGRANPGFDELGAYRVSAGPSKYISMTYNNGGGGYGFSSGGVFYPTSRFVVLSGGTLKLLNNTTDTEGWVPDVTVSSGGKLILETSTTISSCCLMSGGSIQPIPTNYVAGTVYSGAIIDMYYDYLWGKEGVNRSGLLYKAAGANTTIEDGSSYLIMNNVVKTIAGGSHSAIDVCSGAVCTITNGDISILRVSSGGTAIVVSAEAGSGAPVVRDMHVLPGGVFSCINHGYVSSAWIMKGGSMYVSGGGGAYPFMDYIAVMEGATVTVEGFAVSSCSYVVPGGYDTGSGYSLCYYYELYSFYDNGLQTLDGLPVSSGWNSIPYEIVDIKRNSTEALTCRLLLGKLVLNANMEVDTAATEAAAKAAVEGSTITIPNVGMAAGVYPNMFQPRLIELAYNGGPEMKEVTITSDFYPAFKLRQNET